MKIDILLLSVFIVVSGVSANAQQADAARSALMTQMGIQRSGNDFVYNGAALTADDMRKMDGFAATVEPGTDPDAALVKIDREELAAEGRAPDSASADGTIWFSKSPDGWRLTDAGRRAVPSIVLKNTAATAARTPATAISAKPLDLELPASRVAAIVAASGNPNFDSSSSNGPDLPDAPSASVMLKPGSGLAAHTLASAPKPKESALEKDLFWSSWYGYHAAFAADFATTGMVIGKGGYETDHLYTQFGNKNMTGVIGSAVALHAVASVASVALYKEALKKHGAWRRVLEAAAIGINGYGIAVHTEGAAHNVGVLDNWNSPTK